ncbi:MAG: phosphoribosylanthranilate isomerase [Deltaproteobacteria bacterium]|nr:phosphoribosylanthranilate isomerase [Deltaproteobacteria bacterium]
MAAVKICGLTRPRDAELAVQLGAGYLGLNFWPGSPRHISVEAAREIASVVGGRAKLVGVFVAQPPQEVAEIERSVGLDYLQFHGDEPAQQLAPWGNRAIKVIRVEGEPDSSSLTGFQDVWGFLFDIKHPAYGGTGEKWNYRSLRKLDLSRPYWVAGGIGPDNAREALEVSGAFGIDVCSGVEASPGIKSRGSMTQLFEGIFKERSDGQS